VELTDAEGWAYARIICALIAREGILPDDDKLISRICNRNPRWWRAAKAGLIAKGKVWISGSNLMAKRVENTLKEGRKFSEIQSKKARKGWEKRKNLNNNNEASMPERHSHAGNASTTTTTEEEALKASSSSEGVVVGISSERSPDDGELRQRSGVALSSPPSVETRTNPPEASEGKKQLSEEERAAHVARVLRPKPKNFPGSGNDAPLTRAEVGKPNGWDWEATPKANGGEPVPVPDSQAELDDLMFGSARRKQLAEEARKQAGSATGGHTAQNLKAASWRECPNRKTHQRSSVGE
jgi:hypothetical protein